MLAVLAVKVRPVAVANVHGVPVPAIVIAEAPSVRVLVLLFEELNKPIPMVCPLVSSVPLVRVTVAVLPVFNVPVSFQLPPTPLKVTFPAV